MAWSNEGGAPSLWGVAARRSVEGDRSREAIDGPDTRKRDQPGPIAFLPPSLDR